MALHLKVGVLGRTRRVKTGTVAADAVQRPLWYSSGREVRLQPSHYGLEHKRDRSCAPPRKGIALGALKTICLPPATSPTTGGAP